MHKYLFYADIYAFINLKLQSTMNSKKLSTFKLIIKVIAAIATAVLGVIAGKGLGDED